MSALHLNGVSKQDYDLFSLLADQLQLRPVYGLDADGSVIRRIASQSQLLRYTHGVRCMCLGTDTHLCTRKSALTTYRAGSVDLHHRHGTAGAPEAVSERMQSCP